MFSLRSDYDFYQVVNYFILKFGTLGISVMLDTTSKELRERIKTESLTLKQKSMLKAIMRENADILLEYKKEIEWMN